MENLPRPMRARVVLALALFACLAAAPALAALTPGAQQDIRRIERYLNGIETLKATFLQISPDGSEERGTLYIKRPGKLRVDYAPPSPILIVADGKWLTYYDAELNSVNHLRLDETPAALLVRGELAIGGEIAVTDFDHNAGTIRVTLADRQAMEVGRLTLTFSDSPLELRKWTVIDAQGQRTTVVLQDVRLGVELDPDLFVLLAPTVGRSEN